MLTSQEFVSRIDSILIESDMSDVFIKSVRSGYSFDLSINCLDYVRYNLDLTLSPFVSFLKAQSLLDKFLCFLSNYSFLPDLSLLVRLIPDDSLFESYIFLSLNSLFSSSTLYIIFDSSIDGYVVEDDRILFNMDSFLKSDLLSMYFIYLDLANYLYGNQS